MLNKVILIGNLGADPENRTMPNGGTITNVRLATTRKWKDKQGGERKTETEWHRVVLMGKLGEVARDYLHKGSQIYVEGRIRTQKWQDKSGQDRYTTEIIAQDMYMLGGRGENAATGKLGGNSASSPNTMPEDDFDDDIPF